MTLEELICVVTESQEVEIVSVNGETIRDDTLAYPRKCNSYEGWRVVNVEAYKAQDTAVLFIKVVREN